MMVQFLEIIALAVFSMAGNVFSHPTDQSQGERIQTETASEIVERQGYTADFMIYSGTAVRAATWAIATSGSDAIRSHSPSNLYHGKNTAT